MGTLAGHRVRATPARSLLPAWLGACPADPHSERTDVDSLDATMQADLGAAEVRDADLTGMLEALDADLRRMSGKRRLVTGGAGFLGYYLVQVPLAWNDAHPHEPPIHVTVFD